MDERTSKLVACLVFGALIGGVGLFGLISGRAYFPPRYYSDDGPLVSRSKEPGTYWPVVIAQTGVGLAIATMPWWLLR